MPMKISKIEGRVAEIVGDYRLALNVGSKHGVHEDDVFIIYEEGSEIVDPETKRKLGKYEHVKAKVRVEHVQDQICIVKNTQKETITEPSPYSVLSSFGRIQRTVDKELPVSAGKKVFYSQTIQIGDKARRVT